MCGIVAVWRPGVVVSVEEVERLAEKMTHRGPDSSGAKVFRSPRGGVDPEVGLGHRRLAIIDLSPGGYQPMQAGALTIVFNGEIYNYLELREELRSLGREFSTASDTEVLLGAWAEWGTECLSRLNGIFAFVVWDAARGALHAVRDRFGVKPMYWAAADGGVAIASEIRPLLAIQGVDGSVEDERIHDYLARGRLDDGEATFFSGVRRVPAASRLEWSGEGDIRFSKYWQLPRVENAVRDQQEAAEGFRTLFMDSVRLQMRADVPVACCLSGGLDSSSVVSVASRFSAHAMKTFTARFEDASMDEGKYADVVRSACRTEPCDIVIHAADFWESLPNLVRTQEEPFSDPGVFAQWMLMRRIHEEGIRVVLDGQGGDELLCGYAKYFYFLLRDEWNAGRRIAAVRRFAHGMVAGGRHLRNFHGARRYLPGGLGANRLRETLLQPDFETRYRGRSSRHEAGSVREQQFLDIERFSLPALLRYEDKNSMAFSVESRVPFLDHRLTEFCVGLPARLKMSGALAKMPLREGLRGILPEAIRCRRSKLGFGDTYRSWLTDLRSPLDAWLAASTLPAERYVRREACKEMLRRGDPTLFRVLTLDVWMREFHIA